MNPKTGGFESGTGAQEIYRWTGQKAYRAVSAEGDRESVYPEDFRHDDALLNLKVCTFKF